MNVGRAWGVIEVPAVNALRVRLDTDVDGTPRFVVKIDRLEVRFVLPHAMLNLDAVRASSHLAAGATEWRNAVHQLATDQRVIPA